MRCSSKLGIQTAPAIDRSLFATLLSRAKCDTGSDVDCVGITASYAQFIISFYGDREDDYVLNVEDFGKMEKGKWIQFEPTAEQLELLKNRLEEEVVITEQRIVALEREALSMLEDELYYERYGHPGALYSKYY